MERKRKQIYFVSNIIYDADEIHKFYWTALKTLHIINVDYYLQRRSSNSPELSKTHYNLFPSLTTNPIQQQQPSKPTLTLIGAAHQQFSVLVEL